MNSVKISKLICLLLVFNLFLMRPAALGQSYTPAAMIFSCILIIFHFLIGNINNIKKVVVSNDFLQLIFLFLIYWIYVIFISIYYGKSDLTLLIKELLAASVVVFLLFDFSF